MALQEGRWGLRTKAEGQLSPVNLLKTVVCVKHHQISQVSQMHLMMFLLFLIMPSCTAINFSLNDAYTLENHTASWLSVTAPCWICISSRSWDMSNLSQGTGWSTLPAQLHAITQCAPSGHGMALCKRGGKLHALVSATAVFTYPMIASAIPLRPLFSLD